MLPIIGLADIFVCIHVDISTGSRDPQGAGEGLCCCCLTRDVGTSIELFLFTFFSFFYIFISGFLQFPPDAHVKVTRLNGLGKTVRKQL